MPAGTDTTALAEEPLINITTFKRDGTPEATAVWLWRGYDLLMAALRRFRRQAPPTPVTIRIALR